MTPLDKQNPPPSPQGAAPVSQKEWRVEEKSDGFFHLFDENGKLLSDDFHDEESANKVRDAHNKAVQPAVSQKVKEIARKRARHLFAERGMISEYIGGGDTPEFKHAVNSFLSAINEALASVTQDKEEEMRQIADDHFCSLPREEVSGEPRAESGPCDVQGPMEGAYCIGCEQGWHSPTPVHHRIPGSMQLMICKRAMTHEQGLSSGTSDATPVSQKSDKAEEREDVLRKKLQDLEEKEA